jgi:AcrR family transcriptional regulator
MELLDRGGETAVKVKPLTDDLGINVTAIYRYFGDRQGLVNAAQAERYMSGISQDVQTLASALEKATSATNFRKRFNTIAVDILSPQRMPNLMRRANIIGSAHGRPELLALIGEATRTANDDVVDLLRSAQQRGWVLPKADLEVVISWIFSVFFGRLLVWIDPRPPADQEAWIMMVLEPLNQTLFGRKAPRLATLHAQRP